MRADRLLGQAAGSPVLMSMGKRIFPFYNCISNSRTGLEAKWVIEKLTTGNWFFIGSNSQFGGSPTLLLSPSIMFACLSVQL